MVWFRLDSGQSKEVRLVEDGGGGGKEGRRKGKEEGRRKEKEVRK